MLKDLNERERDALQVAVDAIRFDDSSDYLEGLWEIVSIFAPDVGDREELEKLFLKLEEGNNA
jgi:hypothetical protein